MNKLMIIVLFTISSILGILIGNGFAHRDIKIDKLNKENESLRQEIIDYKWQLEQVPYVIESWCNNE